MERSSIGDMVNPPKPPNEEILKEPKMLGLTALKKLEFTNINNIHEELANHMMFLLRELDTNEIKQLVIEDIQKEKIPQTELEQILGGCLSKLVLLEEKNNLFYKFSQYIFDFLKNYSNLDKTPTNQGRKSPLYSEAKLAIEKSLFENNRLPTNSELEFAVKSSINPDEPDSVSYALRTASKHLKRFKKEKGI